ncbi:MAG: hypothetical protein Q4C12_07285, partial [Clostridia bacterium]|nr:hypothetical protein [Clostridia bacterium]
LDVQLLFFLGHIIVSHTKDEIAMKCNWFIKFIKWLLCGIIISVFVNGLYIVSLYIEFPNICYYLVPIPVATLVYFIIHEQKFKIIFSAIGVLLLGNILAEVLLQCFKITNYFYYNLHPNATEVALGEGLVNVLLYGFSILGILIGCIIAFATAILHLRKNKFRDR